VGHPRLLALTYPEPENHVPLSRGIKNQAREGCFCISEAILASGKDGAQMDVDQRSRHDQTMEFDHVSVVSLIYREYCNARLAGKIVSSGIRRRNQFTRLVAGS
jgi:hypothetical protein